MRRYRKKPYKIKPYKSYRRKPKKMKFFLMALLCMFIGLIILGYILPSKDMVPWKPIITIKGGEDGRSKRNYFNDTISLT